MSPKSASYLSPKCSVVEDRTKGGGGVVAIEDIAKGEIVAVWGGYIVASDDLTNVPEDELNHALQVEEHFYLAVLNKNEPSSYFNHSCAPNAGLRGQITLVTMRDIRSGEEVTFDYAMCDSSPYDEFQCRCGAVECRGTVSGRDWRNPELWKRYAGYFSPYIQSRIDSIGQDQPK